MTPRNLTRNFPKSRRKTLTSSPLARSLQLGAKAVALSSALLSVGACGLVEGNSNKGKKDKKSAEKQQSAVGGSHVLLEAESGTPTHFSLAQLNLADVPASEIEKVEIEKQPENGEFVIAADVPGGFTFEPLGSFTGLDEAVATFKTKSGENITRKISLLVRVTHIEDSFERARVIDASTRETFAWTSLIEDNKKYTENSLGEPGQEASESQRTALECNAKICARILSGMSPEEAATAPQQASVESAITVSESNLESAPQLALAEEGDEDDQTASTQDSSLALGPVADGNKALFFWGRPGSSVHVISLLSRPFDMSTHTHARLSFNVLPLDIGDLSKGKSALDENGDGEFFRVEICVKTPAECGVGSEQIDPSGFEKSENWVSVYEPGGQGSESSSEPNGLDGQNHKLEDWIAADVHINLTKLKEVSPELDLKQVVFRFRSRMQDGLKNERDTSKGFEDAVALDNVRLSTFTDSGDRLSAIVEAMKGKTEGDTLIVNVGSGGTPD